MQIEWQQRATGHGISHGWVRFDAPELGAWRWPLTEIAGAAPGPRLCIMAGVHVNESPGMAAAVSLASRIPTARLRGRISVFPLVNVPAEFRPAVAVPIDGVNIHWIFPGAPGGSFSEILAHAIVHEWASGADALIDMHGGDYGQKLTRYVVFQRTGDRAFDDRAEMLARCFDTSLLVAAPPSALSQPGRCSSAMARFGVPAVTSEAAFYGALDEDDIEWHRQGALNVCRVMGMLDEPPEPTGKRRVLIGDYVWLICPADGFIEPMIEPGQLVEQGSRLAVLRDPFHRELSVLHASVTGYVMWRTSQTLAKAGARIGALGVPLPP